MKREDDIKKAIEVMRKGGIILYPTDTVWGIGCDATNADAVAKVYKLKRRDDSKALICLVDSEDRLQRYVRNVPQVAWQLLEAVTKPTTLTNEPFSKELCYRFQKAIVSTSANISGEPAAQNYRDISQEVLNGVDYVCFAHRQEHEPHTPSSIIKLSKDGTVNIIRK